jgi:hypothetical protein
MRLPAYFGGMASRPTLEDSTDVFQNLFMKNRSIHIGD